MELIERLGGVADPAAPASPSQLAALLRREIARGVGQEGAPRAGYDRPLVLAVAALHGPLLVAVPVDGRVRSDPSLAARHPRTLLLIAAALEATVLAAELGPVAARAPLAVGYGSCEGALVIAVPWTRSVGAQETDAELAALQLDERLDGADRLRSSALVIPEAAGQLVFGQVEVGPVLGERHVLRELEVLVRAGLEPAQAVPATTVAIAAGRGGGGGPASAALLDAVLGPLPTGERPHEDPDPARRIARRMLQMLAGKRKWSGGTGAGYHTELTHLTRGFEGSDRELAGAVVEALLAAGLLVEKLSVGQRHVSLHSRRKGEIMALIERGEVPPDLAMPLSRDR